MFFAVKALVVIWRVANWLVISGDRIRPIALPFVVTRYPIYHCTKVSVMGSSIFAPVSITSITKPAMKEKCYEKSLNYEELVSYGPFLPMAPIWGATM